MANWRPVDVRLWDDRKFLACSDGARLLWLFLLTCPSLPIPGVIVGGDAALSEQLGWTPERLRERFHELAKTGLQVRREVRIVWLPNALKYQLPSNPNMVKGWAKKWDDVPEGQLKVELWEALKIACKSWSILFTKLFMKPADNGSWNGLANGSGNGSAHEHQHDHEHEHQHDRERAPAPQTLPDPAESARLGRREGASKIWRELSDLRMRLAAELGLEARPLPAIGDPGERALILRMGEPGAELDSVMTDARHVIAIAEAEARTTRSVQWITGALLEDRSWRRALGMTLADARRPRPTKPGEPARMPARRADPLPPVVVVSDADRAKAAEELVVARTKLFGVVDGGRS